MRETIKALNTTFSAPSVPYPLPDELREAIESFLERYDGIDDHDSQRFHDDLYTIYQRHIVASQEKHGAFMSVLRMLRPAITGEPRLTVWWNAILKPTVDGAGHKRQQIEDATEVALSILVYDPEADRDGEHARLSRLFTKRTLDAYLARTNVPLSPQDIISTDNELVTLQLESLIVKFGRKMPKVTHVHILHCSKLTATGAPPFSRRALRTEAVSHTGIEPFECIRSPAASTSPPRTRNIPHPASRKVPSHRCFFHCHRTCARRTHHVPATHLRFFDFGSSSSKDVLDIFQSSLLGQAGGKRRVRLDG
jgi:hypothetical protein